MKAKSCWLLCGLLLSGGVSVAETDRNSVGDIGASGAALLKPFKQQLKQALISGIQEGPVAAIDACRIQAPEITAANSVDGIEVGRSSLRLRNPGNEPTDWMRDAMGHWQDSGDLTPVVRQLDADTVAYAEPIVLQPMCVTCHGKSIAPDVVAAIAERYPDDQATGYVPGDLRGMFWVSFPTPE